MSILKFCHTCQSYHPSLYRGKESKIGACIHLSFFKIGLGHITKEGVMEVTLKAGRNRPEVSQVGQAFSNMDFFLDVIDLRIKHRVCPNWAHALLNLPETLNVYPDLTEKVRQEESLPSQWLSAGFPSVQRTLPKFYPYSLHEWHILDSEPKYQEYLPCQICEYAEPIPQWEEGPPEPYILNCTLKAIQSPILGDFANKSVVPSSHTCKHFLFKKVLNPKDYESPIPMSGKIFPFVETNPPQPSIEEAQALCRLPNVWKRNMLTDQERQRLHSINFDEFIQQLDHNPQKEEIIEIYHLKPTQLFFGKGIAKQSQQMKETKNQMKHHQDALDMIRNLK